MYEVRFTALAREQFDALPLIIKVRVQAVVERLRQWPQMSGVKALRRDLKGSFRIRTGDWRVLFTVDINAECITIFRVDNRRDVYE